MIRRNFGLHNVFAFKFLVLEAELPQVVVSSQYQLQWRLGEQAVGAWIGQQAFAGLNQAFR